MKPGVEQGAGPGLLLPVQHAAVASACLHK